MTGAGRPITDEELRRQLDRRVSVAPLTPDDRTNLIRAARVRRSEPARPSFGPRALGWVAGIAAVVVLALISIPLLIGSMATPTPTPTPAPTGMIGPNGVTLDQALSIAQSHVPEGAELWSYAPDRVDSAVQKIFGPGSQERPAGVPDDTLIWAVAFRVGDGLTTVYLNLLTGAWLENRETPAPLPTKHRSDIVFYEPLVHVLNGTTLVLHVSVNDGPTMDAPAHRETVIDPRPIDPPPWRLVVTTSGGRELLTLDVRPQDNYYTTGDYPHSGAGDAQRLYLSCGQFDMWVGAPMAGGPPPESGYPPHDCDP